MQSTGNDPFLGLVVSVDGKGDPLFGERPPYPVLDQRKLAAGKSLESVVEQPVVLAGPTVGTEHLVMEGLVKIVGVAGHACVHSVVRRTAARAAIDKITLAVRRSSRVRTIENQRPFHQPLKGHCAVRPAGGRGSYRHPQGRGGSCLVMCPGS